MFRTVYSHDRAISALYATINNEESMTQQDDAKDCDINVIVKRYTKTGQLPNVTKTPMSGDFTNAIDYREAMDRIKEANDTFMSVPAQIRKRFNNDPAEFLEFTNNPNNLDELRKLGLAEKEKPAPIKPPPMEVIITNPEAPT